MQSKQNSAQPEGSPERAAEAEYAAVEDISIPATPADSSHQGEAAGQY